MKYSLGLILFFTIAFGLSACKPPSSGTPSAAKPEASPAPTPTPSTVTGGQDPGGGYALVSTAEEVRSALNDALDLAEKSNIEDNIFYSYLKSKALAQSESEKETFNLIAQVIGGLPPDCLPKDLAWEKTNLSFLTCHSLTTEAKAALENRNYFAETILKSRIRFEEDKACLVGKDNHADASVSEHKVGADICFSIKNLRRLPRTDLQREILSLILHEMSHIAGFDEEKSVKIQNDFSEFFVSKFGTISKFSDDDALGWQFGYAKSSIDTVLNEKFDLKNPMVSLAVQAAAGLNYDFMAGDLWMKLIVRYNPKYIRILEGIFILSENISLRASPLRYYLCENPLNCQTMTKQLSNEEVREQLKALQLDLNRLADNWNALIGKGKIVNCPRSMAQEWTTTTPTNFKPPQPGEKSLPISLNSSPRRVCSKKPIPLANSSTTQPGS